MPECWAKLFLFCVTLAVGNYPARVTVMGDTFNGKYVPDELLECLASSGTEHTVSDLCQCSQATVDEGHEMFTWENLVCTSYPEGIPSSWPACDAAGGTKVYSTDGPDISLPVITDLAAVVGENISITWNNLLDSCITAYRVEFNGETRVVYGTSITFDMFDATDCEAYPLDVSAVNPVTEENTGLMVSIPVIVSVNNCVDPGALIP